MTLVEQMRILAATAQSEVQAVLMWACLSVLAIGCAVAAVRYLARCGTALRRLVGWLGPVGSAAVLPCVCAAIIYGAEKHITISLTKDTATNLTFACDVSTNYLGEAAWFRCKVDGLDYNPIVGSTFFVPSTNFTRTISGNYISGGKLRKVQMVVEHVTNGVSNVISR